MGTPLTGWKRKATYGLFFAAVFVLALSRTFPAEAVRDRLVLEAGAAGMQLHIDEIGPSGLAGIAAKGVRLETREGVPLVFDQVSASLRIWMLVVGRQSVAFDARLLDGRIQGVYEKGGSWSRVAVACSGLELAKSEALRKMTGLDLAGKLGADIDVRLEEKDPAKSTGRIEVAIENGAIRGGELAGLGMSMPTVTLGKLTAQATVKDGKATFEKLGVKSEDLEANADGFYIMVQPNLEYAPIFGKAHFKPTEAFWSKSGAASFRSLAEMALQSAKGPDGFYGFQIYGTLTNPQGRPML